MVFFPLPADHFADLNKKPDADWGVSAGCDAAAWTGSTVTSSWPFDRVEIRAGTVRFVRPVQGGRCAGAGGWCVSDAVKSGRHTDVSAYVQINGAVWVSDMWTRDPSVIGTTILRDVRWVRWTALHGSAFFWRTRELKCTKYVS